MSIGKKALRLLIRGVAWIVSLVNVSLGVSIASRAPREAPPAFPDVLVLTTDEDLVWLVKAQEARLSQLETARTAAKDWATTITAVTGALGIVALIKGPEEIGRLTRRWEIAVGIVLLVAVLLALRGIVLAALAAQGTPRSFGYSPAGYREHYFYELELASVALRVSRIAVVLSTLALIAAVGMTWYGEEEKKQGTNVYAVQKSGAALCGELSAKNGVLQVTDSEGGVTPLPAENLLAVVPAGKCP